MNMNDIRAYLAADSELKALVGDNIFLFECPEQLKCSDYVVYNFKQITGASIVKQYQLDIRAVSTKPLTALKIKDRCVKLLDIYDRPVDIPCADEHIKSCQLISGGGMARNDEGEYNVFAYFVVVTAN